jgi:hypothetical protein
MIKVKSEAEMLFFQMSRSPNEDIIMTLIRNGSDTLVFVIFSLIMKYPANFSKDQQLVKHVIDLVHSWQFTPSTLIRANKAAF